ncbi:hypothetical protein L596_010620 [Steinernema carpocapsae]|uniref:Granulins domain-containing protein n=1 Tax=Steinernema carpocapsae TaxID=34508 RepID=A0A4V6A6Y2_STECR|nr:hypothetical protein L596_010620 [Steinernema carpocapsae]
MKTCVLLFVVNVVTILKTSLIVHYLFRSKNSSEITASDVFTSDLCCQSSTKSDAYRLEIRMKRALVVFDLLTTRFYVRTSPIAQLARLAAPSMMANMGVYENAVCCKDMIHCCPTKTHCHPEQGRCMNHNLGINVTMKSKLPSRPHSQEVYRLWDDVPCDEGQNFCRASDRCSLLNNGNYGCCPLKFNSCSDGLYCCMEGSVCDLENFRCVLPEGFVRPMIKKVPARLARENEDKILVNKAPSFKKNAKCPDGKSQCPEQTTCCLVGDEQYGCCPVPNAVCCSDHLHCCPEGTHCHVTEGRCVNHVEEINMKWLRKFPATPLVTKKQHNFYPSTPSFEEKDIQEFELCSDYSTCKADSQCCPTGRVDGAMTYKCCPLTNGVCCSDGCCPFGFKCEANHCEKLAVWYDALKHHKHSHKIVNIDEI